LTRKCRRSVVHLVFGVLWQIIKQGLLSKVNVSEHPELLELGLDAAELERLGASHPEELLLRWVNFHLNNAGSERTMTNFTNDVMDSEIYVTLLNHLAPDECSKEILKKTELPARAEALLESAELLGCRRFVTANDIVSGNYKLNMAFVANLFDKAAMFERAAAKQREKQLQSMQQTQQAQQQALAEADKRAAAAAAAEREAHERAGSASVRGR
jgi:hypothetical protein